MGKRDGDSDQSDVIGSPGAGITLDLGVGATTSIVLGLWADFSLHAGGDRCKSSGVESVTCRAYVWAVGPYIAYVVPTEGSVRPWVSGGFGYRWQLENVSVSAGDVTAASNLQTRGIEALRLAGGVDFRVSSHFYAGPFAALTVGTYTKYAINGDFLVSDSTGYRLDSIGEDGDIDEFGSTGSHQFLFLGARAAFDVPLRK